MKRAPITKAPADAAARRAIKPVPCCSLAALPRPDLAAYRALRNGLERIETVVVPPRDGATFMVPAGHFFRLSVAKAHR